MPPNILLQNAERNKLAAALYKFTFRVQNLSFWLRLWNIKQVVLTSYSCNSSTSRSSTPSSLGPTRRRGTAAGSRPLRRRRRRRRSTRRRPWTPSRLRRRRSGSCAPRRPPPALRDCRSHWTKDRAKRYCSSTKQKNKDKITNSEIETFCPPQTF